MSITAIIEILIIAGIVAAQFRIFGKNTGRIRSLAQLYPSSQNLRIEEVDFTKRPEAPKPIAGSSYVGPFEALIAGEPFTSANYPNATQKVVESDPYTIAISVTGHDEKALKTEYNISTESLKKKIQEGTIHFENAITFREKTPEVQPQISKEPSRTADLIKAENASPEFREIVSDTNEYLENNKGAAADFNILKDISERYSEALDNEVQAGIATPLYIGLLGTFIGVSMGLGSLLLGKDSEAGGSFITDEGIRNFLAGVVIAMIGSFCGLLLTLRGNSALKDARSQRDKLKNAYYTFLQKRLLPKLNSDMAVSLGNLKSVLDSFNHDFLEKVANFQPIIASLTDNISIQKEFIQRLNEIGFTQMANASIQVFEKVRESEETFNKFLGYQKALNNTLENGSEMAGKVGEVLDRMTKLEEAFNLVPGYLAKHDEAIMRQVQFFDRHKRELDNIASRVEQNFDKDADQIAKFMDIRMDQLERDAQNAYERWQQHFQQLNQDNIYQRILDYMQPFQKLNEQQETLNTQHNQLAKTVSVTNEKLLQKLEQDSELQRTLAAQLDVTTKLLEEATRRNRLQVVMDKVFGTPENYKPHGKIK